MKKTVFLMLALCLVLGGCGARREETLPVRVMVLNGSTGFGMAKLISDSAPEDYAFSVETDAAAVTAALVNGSCDIAALPTNAAAALYQKSGGAICCLALNTRGVLWLASDGSVPVSSLSDLEGQRVWVPAQNPAFIFSALCEKAGVSVTADTGFAQPADLRAALAAGKVPLAVLPEPLLSAACAANPRISPALDLTAEWDALFPAGSLVQGCVVARREFAESQPEAVSAFLRDCEASLAFCQTSPEEAADCIAALGLAPSAALAAEALPRCNLCFLTGSEMAEALSAYLEIMLEQAPASVGGALPESDFYYGA